MNGSATTIAAGRAIAASCLWCLDPSAIAVPVDETISTPYDLQATFVDLGVFCGAKLVASWYLGTPQAAVLRSHTEGHTRSLTQGSTNVKAKWSISKDGAFVCEAEDLERLTRLLELEVGEISWEIACADGVTRSGDNVAMLLEFDNAPNRKIQRLRLHAGGYVAERSASVQLGGSLDVLHVSIDGPAEVVDQLRPALESQLSGLRVWYGRVADFDFLGASMLFLFLLGGTLFLAVVLLESSNESAETSRRPQAIFITVIVGIPVIAWGLNKIRDRLFPRVTFAIGQGKRRHEHLEKVRWGVIVAFGVSLSAGLVLLGFP